MKKTLDLVNDVVKAALLNNSHAWNAANTQWSDISANEISGPGYTAGGATLATKAVTQDDVGNRGVFSAADVTWTNLTADVYNCVLYDTTTATKWLFCNIDTGYQHITGGDLTIKWSTSGIIAVT